MSVRKIDRETAPGARNRSTAAWLAHVRLAASLPYPSWVLMPTLLTLAREHVDGAVNIPLADLKTRIAAEVPDKNDTIHVYCNVGRQSGQAQQMLSEMGYTQVVNAGGLSQIARPKSASK